MCPRLHLSLHSFKRRKKTKHVAITSNYIHFAFSNYIHFGLVNTVAHEMPKVFKRHQQLQSYRKHLPQTIQRKSKDNVKQTYPKPDLWTTILWQSNMALENLPCLDGFPIKTSIYSRSWVPEGIGGCNPPLMAPSINQQTNYPIGKDSSFATFDRGKSDIFSGNRWHCDSQRWEHVQLATFDFRHPMFFFIKSPGKHH